MSNLTTSQFSEFFGALSGYEPFPWQSMLLEQVVSEGWPDLIDLPTASGKTACIDVAVFALAMGAPTPRRIWLVVDRRIVVDEAYERATKIAVALRFAAAGDQERKEIRKDAGLDEILRSVTDCTAPVLVEVGQTLRRLGGSRDKPLAVGRLRGGVPRDIAWAGNPAQPAVLTSTIDQLGSRLLFRGYGLSPHTQPVHAALAGNDSLIVLDEAHLAGPFLQTVSAIEHYRRTPWAAEPLNTPFKLVVMSATPPQGMSQPACFPPDECQRAAALNHPLLHQRTAAPKPTELSVAVKPKLGKDKSDAKPVVTDDELVLHAANAALQFLSSGRQRIAVMVNRVKTARNIADQLGLMNVDAEVGLLTGRLRPLDRDELVRRWSPTLKSGSKLVSDRPIILCTTQCLEVGADFSFDALISECASLDALRQRFGRLSRLGEFPAASGIILIRKADIRAEKDLDDDRPLDPIYGNAIARTWNWLNSDGTGSILMGIDDLEPRIANLHRQEGAMAKLVAARREAPLLLPAYLDIWSQTSWPQPAIEPDVPLFLHGIPPVGERPRAEVRVLWRRDVAEASRPNNEGKIVPALYLTSLIAALPPLSGEMLQLPLRDLVDVLNGLDDEATTDADLEGVTETVESPRETKRTREPDAIFLICRGRNKDILDKQNVDMIRPNDVIVFPADSPTFKTLIPNARHGPDVYEEAYLLQFGVVRRRIFPSETIESETGEFDLQSTVAKLLAEIPPDQQSLFVKPRPIRYAPRFYHFTGKAIEHPLDLWESDDDDNDSLYIGESVSLAEHTRDVVAAAAHLCKLLPSNLDEVTRRAAELHDIGKADQRFQYVLNHGKCSRPVLLGKSAFRLPREDEATLYHLSGLPKGFRHELLSAQMTQRLGPEGPTEQSIDLLLHLIGAHHGQCRPFARVVDDPDPTDAICPFNGTEISISAAQRSQTPPHRLDSGVAERFWRLTRRFGWWGLAYLEAILRCADTHASAFAEQEQRK